tara:strand:- start:148 stop:411 length:264 start_codon:yes stop_codon:yes gene_type:complete
MKIFVYKCLFASFIFLILFYLTFGVIKKQLNREIENFISKENIEFVKEKLKKEMKNASEKEKILNKEDAKIINNFLKKIQKELQSQN